MGNELGAELLYHSRPFFGSYQSIKFLRTSLKCYPFLYPGESRVSQGEVPSGTASEVLFMGSSSQGYRVVCPSTVVHCLILHPDTTEKAYKNDSDKLGYALRIPFCQMPDPKLLGFPVSEVGVNNFNGILIFPKSLIISETNSPFLHLYLDIGNKCRQFLTKIE